MPRQLTADDARQSLTAHLAAKGAEICARFGPSMGWLELQALLSERAFVRYPCVVRFDASDLLPGEFAHPVQTGDRPEDGFVMQVHPLFENEPHRVPLLVLYQLVVVNYGDFATHEDAEVFASSALGMERDDYYGELCGMADRLAASQGLAVDESGACQGGCSCGGAGP